MAPYQTITNKAPSFVLKRHVSTLEKMGFPEMLAVAALRRTDNDLNAAMDALQRRRRKGVCTNDVCSEEEGWLNSDQRKGSCVDLVLTRGREGSKILKI